MKTTLGIAGVALAAALVAACAESMVDPVTGSIVGTVKIDGTGVAGITVTLDGTESITTGEDGKFRFDNVPEGVHTVTISGLPPHAGFEQSPATATIATHGETVVIDFNGWYVRTARSTTWCADTSRCRWAP